jgi:ech hydrogenase subunit A
MNLVAVLMLFPLIASGVIFLVRNDYARNVIVRISACIIGILSLVVVYANFKKGLVLSFKYEHIIDYCIMAASILIAVYIIYTGIKNKKYLAVIFAAVQTPLMIWFELTYKHGIEIHNDIMFDKLSAIMVLIVGLIGSLICLYAVGYMKWYHVHHDEYKERKSFFFAVLFLFISAMTGLVLSNSLTLMYFCWEVTSLSSFLLIGYTKTEEAKNNAFRALSINLGGGLAFARYNKP